MQNRNDRPLKICLLSYRSNPHCGGQGVYLKNLSSALADLGHHVEVISGPPDPCLDTNITVHRLSSLDLYDPADPFRLPTVSELADPLNLAEWLGVSTMGFPEPFIFGLRAYRFLKSAGFRYDIVHDNQSLSYGIWAMGKKLPVTATIHHPITVDRDITIKAQAKIWQKMKQWRWYSFIGMQKRVARTLSHIISVSHQAGNDIGKAFGISRDRFRIVPNGIDVGLFRPMPGIKRDRHRIIVTNSADTPLKGLDYLLISLAKVAQKHPVKLYVVGEPKKNGRILQLIRDLDIGDRVRFTGRINAAEFVRQYARSGLAVVPSLYEGFGLPVGEAMACGVPVICTTGGALPEVVGDAGRLVPPADVDALAAAIVDMLENPETARKLGQAGYRRVQAQFTWNNAAERTVDAYREVIRDYGRL